MLLVYARLMNLRAGDVLRFSATGPGGFAVSETSAPLDRNKATYIAFAGKRRKQPRWASGRYEGRVELVRAGAVVQRPAAALDIP